MASFDIIDSASAGYALVWGERSYLVKLAAAPFLIKLVCCIVVVLLGWEHNTLRQALVMLPSYFADGWLFSHLTRLIFFDQRWPFRPSGNTERDMQVLRDRALGIMRGTLTFVVIRFLMAGITAILQMGNAGANAEAQQVTFGMFAGSLLLLAAAVWAFRLVWLYIPAAANYPLRRFLQDVGGYGISWYLIGIWLFCFIPPFFIIKLILTVIIGPAQPGPELLFLTTSVSVLLDLLIGTFSTAAIALAIRKYFSAGRGA